MSAISKKTLATVQNNI